MLNKNFVLTPRQLKESVITVLKAGLVPFIQGTPGCGKSEIVKQIGEQFNCKVIDHRLSTSDICDLNGLPQFKDNRATFTPFDIFPLEDTPLPQGKNAWILFLDEFNSASKAVQAACYKLILDRSVGQHKLHPKVWIVCAGNQASDNAVVTEMSSAMTSRLIQLNVAPDFEQWLEDVALPRKYNSIITGFLNYKPSYLNTFNPDNPEDSYCCPRTWDFANKLLNTKTDFETLQPILAGTLDAGVAIELIAFAKLYKDLPSIASIEANPMSAILVSSLDQKWAITTSLIEHVSAKNLENFCQYIERFNDDSLLLLFLRVITKQHKDLLNDTVFKRLVRFKDILNGYK